MFTKNKAKISEEYGDLKNRAKIVLEITDKSLFFEIKFFSKCSKKFLLAI